MYIPKSTQISYDVRVVDETDSDKSHHIFTVYIRNTSKVTESLARRMREHGIVAPRGTTRYCDMGNGKIQLVRRRDEYPLVEFILHK